MERGRPRKYETAEELEAAVFDYFKQFEEVENIEDLRKKPTVAGLALHLGFASRQSIYDYAENGAFSYVIKKALLALEDYHEGALSGNNVTGHVFWLKNHGWADKKELDGSFDVTQLVIEAIDDEASDDENADEVSAVDYNA